MFGKIKNYLILPTVLLIISAYLLGLSFWQNRAVHTDSPYLNEAVYTDEGYSGDIAADEFAEQNETLININTATAEELVMLNGIGTAIAERIISHREAIGGYKTKEQLMEVKGIGEKLFGNIKDYIVVD